jgi:pimeloyl-ACP methyl ester carboxylesterase
VNVAVIPGLPGTNLHDKRYGKPPGRKVWVDYASIAVGGLVLLDLDEEGDGAGPLAQGAMIVHGDLQEPYYGGLLRLLRKKGHNAIGFGWDWRKDMLSEGVSVATDMKTSFGKENWVIVAHSAGGLVARIAMREAQDLHFDQQITTIIYLGTPHYGTYYALSAFTREASLYQNIAHLMGQLLSSVGHPAQIVLDYVLGRTVALYELLPAYGYGPLWNDNPDGVAALYNLQNWQQINPFMLQSRLDSAKLFWSAMKTLRWPSKEQFIAGQGQRTPDGYSTSTGTLKVRAAVYHDKGDNTVELRSAVPGDAQKMVASSKWAHEELPLDPEVQKIILAALADAEQPPLGAALGGIVSRTWPTDRSDSVSVAT